MGNITATKKRPFLPFGYKLMLSYLLFVMTPVVGIGYYAYTSTVQAVKERTSANLTGTLKQIRDNVQYKIEDIKRISDLLYWDFTLQDNLRRYEEGWYSYETTVKYLMPKFSNTINATGGNIGLAVYLENEAMPELYYLHDPQADPLQSGEKRYEVFHLKRIEDAAWYRELPFLDGYDDRLLWKQIGEDETFHNISLLRRLNDIQEMKQIGFIRIRAKLADLFQAVDYTIVGEESLLFVLDDRGRPVHASYAGAGTDAIERLDMLASGHLVLEQPLPELNWRLVALIPNALLEESANRIRNVTVLVCLGGFLTLACLGFFVSRYFSKRVTKIVFFLNMFREGNFHKRIKFSGNDEFAQIAAALNEMGEHIVRLIEEVYVTNLQKKEAELAMLQAQINPHFLYNTLSSISRLGKLGQIDRMHDMILGLARFYRLSLSDGRTIIRIAKELEQARTYIDIQKIKHGDRLEVGFDIDPGVLGYDTVKLILQPFIENALQHAWYGDRIHIRVVAAREEDRIVFKVIDNGVGFAKGTVARLTEPGKERSGYGIRNVDERIKLQFGNDYGVSIYSGPGIGTCVRIVIPAFKHAGS